MTSQQQFMGISIVPSTMARQGDLGIDVEVNWYYDNLLKNS